jgi:hypothetical protein
MKDFCCCLTCFWIFLTSCVTHSKTAHDQRFSYSAKESIKRGLFVSNYVMISKPGKVHQAIGLKSNWLDSIWFEKAWINRGQYSFAPGYKILRDGKGQIIGRMKCGCGSAMSDNMVSVKIGNDDFGVSGLHRVVLGRHNKYIYPADTIVGYLKSAKHPNAGLDTLFFVKQR